MELPYLEVYFELLFGSVRPYLKELRKNVISWIKDR